LFANELPGRELAGLESLESCKVDALFQGAAEPFAGPMPGKTETGFAFKSAVTDWIEIRAAGFVV